MSNDNLSQEGSVTHAKRDRLITSLLLWGAVFVVAAFAGLCHGGLS